MLELSVFKFAVDLFEKFIKGVREAGKDRREKFERTCKPLFENLEPIANEYFLTVEEAIRGLKKPNANLDDLFDNIAKRRAAIVIARDGIVGQADAFKGSFGEFADKDEYARHALAFADAVSSYFTDAGSAILGGPRTAIRGLLTEIDEVRNSHFTDENELSQQMRDLIKRAENRLEMLQSKWKEVARHYKALQ
ncbi:hypothetical protein JQ633_32045 [Bradyrhizobium tropiciagri]|uniref:hypothetical protein n=1 Tax=Bradyrhizobium tropiciagri TaxID=312253 RepID=UPI001BAA2022|nr:hypothetical protein [Bradyrhizobium tropiciagri]MBR0875029.1 hypothetical protein [Bradyrhizobium tropiciagri]